MTAVGRQMVKPMGQALDSRCIKSGGRDFHGHRHVAWHTTGDGRGHQLPRSRGAAGPHGDTGEPSGLPAPDGRVARHLADLDRSRRLSNCQPDQIADANCVDVRESQGKFFLPNAFFNAFRLSQGVIACCGVWGNRATRPEQSGAEHSPPSFSQHLSGQDPTVDLATIREIRKVGTVTLTRPGCGGPPYMAFIGRAA